MSLDPSNELFFRLSQRMEPVVGMFGMRTEVHREP